MTGWNLPDGVRESDLPGNRPEDMEAERFADNLTDEDLIGYIEEELVGDLISEREEGGGWEVESAGIVAAHGLVWDEGEWISFSGETAKYDCIALLLCERWDWIEEKLIEKHLEDEAERALDYEAGGGLDEY
jgi:hypothetical protein